jgi:ABC-type lipopolysaccharide export system ATPase subunit
LNITDYPQESTAWIGYLAQEASVFRKLSIEDNIERFAANNFKRRTRSQNGKFD